MDTRNNHYEFLGLDVASPPDRVRAAVDRLARHANAIAHTSPERSHALWERIREIRADLLSDPARRQAYDVALLRAMAPPEPRVQPPRPAGTPPSRPRVAVRPARPAGPDLLPALPMAGLAAALLAAVAVIAIAVLNLTGSHTPVPSRVALREQGAQKNHEYLAGHPVQLTWTPASGATKYRLEVATAQGTLTGANAFAHPVITRVSPTTHFSLKVHGGYWYAWRVQAYVNGQWQPYTPARLFYVAQPKPAEVAVRRAPTPQPTHRHRTYVRKKRTASHHAPRTHARRPARHAGHRTHTRRRPARHSHHAARPPEVAAVNVTRSSGRSGQGYTPPSITRPRPAVVAPRPHPATSSGGGTSRPATVPTRPPHRTPPPPPPAPTAIPAPTMKTYPFGYGRPAVGPPGPPGIP